MTAHRYDVKLVRVYHEPAADDGVRVLVDRVWPRGLTKDRANLDDRTLDVIAVEHLSIRRLLQVAVQPILGITRPIRGVHTFHTAHLAVHTLNPVDVTIDGEIVGKLPADFRVAGDALRVVTPQQFDDLDAKPTMHP